MSDQSADKNRMMLEDMTTVQEENIRLRKKLRRRILSGTMPVGLGLILAGAGAIAGSYFADSVVLTLAGLGLVFWGVIMLYISPGRFLPEKVVELMSISMSKSIDKLIVSLNYKGRTVFLHPRHLKGISQGYVFIPFEPRDEVLLPNDEALSEEKLVYDNPRGVFMVAPSQGLVELIEKELGANIATLDMAFLGEQLPKLLVNNLRLLDSMTIQQNQSFTVVTMTGEAAAKVCRTLTKETTIGAHFGCPLCASMGLIISKVAGKPVTIVENKVQEAQNVITTTYRTVEI